VAVGGEQARGDDFAGGDGGATDVDGFGAEAQVAYLQGALKAQQFFDGSADVVRLGVE